MKRKYGAWHLNRGRAEYLRSGSIEKAAAHARTSTTWLYLRLKDEGLVEDAVSYGSLTRRRFIEVGAALYNDPDRPLSCRGVEAALKASGEYECVPSHAWFYERFKELGILRNRSQSLRARAIRENGLRYDEMEASAWFLYVEKKWSQRRVADHLGVSRGFVKRTVGEEKARSISEQMYLSAYEAATLEVRKRWARIIAVADLRFGEGLSYDEIHERTGHATATVERYLHLYQKGTPRYRSPHRRSRFRGVYWNRNHRRWRAEITIEGERAMLGSFEEETDAAEAYDQACLERGLIDRMNRKPRRLAA